MKPEYLILKQMKGLVAELPILYKASDYFELPYLYAVRSFFENTFSIEFNAFIADYKRLSILNQKQEDFSKYLPANARKDPKSLESVDIFKKSIAKNFQLFIEHEKNHRKAADFFSLKIKDFLQAMNKQNKHSRALLNEAEKVFPGFDLFRVFLAFSFESNPIWRELKSYFMSKMRGEAKKNLEPVSSRSLLEVAKDLYNRQDILFNESNQNIEGFLLAVKKEAENNGFYLQEILLDPRVQAAGIFYSGNLGLVYDACINKEMCEFLQLQTPSNFRSLSQ